ncbi:MAG: helix-turn-helix transcriptional regulator, partial [Pseudolabrys sp.]
AEDTMPDPTSLLEIGARLAVTRKALGLTQAEMDRMMGSTYTDGQTCNTYETGRQRIPTHHALALCRTCGLPLIGFIAGRCTACSLTSAPRPRPS